MRFIRAVALSVAVLAMAACDGAAVPRATSTPSPSRSPLFARGSCMTLEPDGKPKGIVFIDAGHGGVDPGATGHLSNGARVHEKDATLGLARAAGERVRALGYRVVLSRTTDSTVIALRATDTRDHLFTPAGKKRDLQGRIACANRARADVLLSIHANAFGDPAEGGTMTLYDPDRPFARANKRFAELLHARVLSAVRSTGTRVQDRLVIRDTVSFGRTALTTEGARYGHEPLLGPQHRTYVPTPSAMPGAILEALFITRPEEADLLFGARGRALIAEAIAGAVRAFLG